MSAAAQPGLATDPARLARTSAGAEAESDRAPQPESPDSGAVQDQAAEPGVAAPSEPAGVAAGSDPLPTPDQRRAYLHVFIAFGVAWALILGYVVLLGRRIAEARRQFERLREREGFLRVGTGRPTDLSSLRAAAVARSDSRSA